MHVTTDIHQHELCPCHWILKGYSTSSVIELKKNLTAMANRNSLAQYVVPFSTVVKPTTRNNRAICLPIFNSRKIQTRNCQPVPHPRTLRHEVYGREILNTHKLAFVLTSQTYIILHYVLRVPWDFEICYGVPVLVTVIYVSNRCRQLWVQWYNTAGQKIFQIPRSGITVA